MPPRDIPGYHYDEVKRRYFKIEANHEARPDSQHAAQNVRQLRKRNESRKRKHNDMLRNKKERIQRASFLATSPRLDTQRAKLPSTYRHSYLTGLQPYHCIIHPLDMRDWAIRDFVYHPGSDITFYGQGKCVALIDNAMIRWSKNTPKPLEVPGLEFLDRSLDNSEFNVLRFLHTQRESFGLPADYFRSRVQSLSIHQGTDRVLATSNGSGIDSRSSIQFYQYRPNIVFSSDIPHPRESSWLPTEGYKFEEHSHIWKTAVRPDNSSSEATFTLATSHGVKAITQGSTVSVVNDYTTLEPINLTYCDTNVLALAFREGKIPFYDSRTGYSTPTLNLQHSGNIAAIETADDPFRLVVAGYGTTMCLYDIRMPRPQRPRPRRKRKFAQDPQSMPVVQFHDYENGSKQQISVAVHAELGLVAAPTEVGGVQVSSLQDGELLRDYLPLAEGPVAHLKWLEGKQGVPELWVAVGETLHKYSWSK